MMSLRAAVEPVAMAMWLGAVRDGFTVALRKAVVPLLTSRPSPLLEGIVPSCMNSRTRLGVAPSSEMMITRDSAKASVASNAQIAVRTAMIGNLKRRASERGSSRIQNFSSYFEVRLSQLRDDVGPLNFPLRAVDLEVLKIYSPFTRTCG